MTQKELSKNIALACSCVTKNYKAKSNSSEEVVWINQKIMKTQIYLKHIQTASRKHNVKEDTIKKIFAKWR